MHVGSLAGATAVAAATLLSCTIAPIAHAGAVPAYISSYQSVEVAFPRSGGPEATIDSASLTAFGQRFDLVLEPSSVVADGAANIVVDALGSHQGTTPKRLYRGHLADDAEADVRVSVRAGALDGYVRRGGHTYFLEPLSRYQADGAGRTLVYRDSDLDAAALPAATCGADARALRPGSGTAAGGASGLSPRTSGSGLGLLEVTLVADFAMYQLHGADTADYMLSIANQVDGYYMIDLGVTLQVAAAVVYASPGIEPFSSTSDPFSLLQNVAAARAAASASGGVLAGGAATHLFTGRDLAGSVIGMAYVDAVCDRSLGVGLSQNFVQNNHMMSLLVGHEIGHNLGALHDGVAGSPCSATGYGFVMWPSLASDLAEQFSTCSQASIAPVVEAAACITPAIPPGCGDGVVSGTEQCDDGNNAGGDCCRSNCTLDPTGTRCADDADACTDDVCDGAGSCGHPFNTAPCDDQDICTFDGICASGSCVPQYNYQPLGKFKLKATVRPDLDNDTLVLGATLAIAKLSSPPTAGGTSIRLADAADAVLYQAAVPAALWNDPKGTGTSFLFHSDDPLARQTNGLVSMSVKYPRNSGLAKIKAKVAAADLSLLQGQTALSVRVQIGDDLAGDCGQVLEVACTAKGSSLVCR